LADSERYVKDEKGLRIPKEPVKDERDEKG
jgi:hypothetical protein